MKKNLYFSVCWAANLSLIFHNKQISTYTGAYQGARNVHISESLLCFAFL